MKKQKFDRKNPPKYWLAGACSLSLAALMAANPAFAKAPDAGSSIGLRAYAEFTDSNDEVQKVQSNEVLTTVQAVYGLDVSDAQKQAVTAGGSVKMIHEITNTGNADDSFKVALASLASSMAGIDKVVVYVDTSGTGIPDSGDKGTVLFADGKATSATLSTASIKRDTKSRIIVEMVVNKAQSVGDLSAQFTVTSQHDTAQSASFTDTVQVAEGAIMQVSPKVGVASVLRDQPFNSEFEVRNNGSQDGFVYLEIPKPADANFEIDRDMISFNGEKFLANGVGKINNKPYVIDDGDKSSVKLAFYLPAGAGGKLNVGMKVVKGQPGDKGKIDFKFGQAKQDKDQPVLELDATNPTNSSGSLQYEIRSETAAIKIGNGYSAVIAPGKTAFYTHFLSNLTQEKIKAGLLTIAAKTSQAGMTVRVYADPHGLFKGLPEGLEQLTEIDLHQPQGNLGLELNATADLAIVVAVTARDDASMNGVHDEMVMTITGMGTTLTVKDKTLVRVGASLQVKKMQQVDPSCSITDPARTNWTQSPMKVSPGECVWYRVTVHNQGKESVHQVKLRDVVPSGTSLFGTVLLVGPKEKVELVAKDSSQKFGANIQELGNFDEFGMEYRLKLDGRQADAGK